MKLMNGKYFLRNPGADSNPMVRRERARQADTDIVTRDDDSLEPSAPAVRMGTYHSDLSALHAEAALLDKTRSMTIATETYAQVGDFWLKQAIFQVFCSSYQLVAGLWGERPGVDLSLYEIHQTYDGGNEDYWHKPAKKKQRRQQRPVEMYVWM